MTLARHYQAATPAGYVADMPYERPGGLVEANASFELRGPAGELFTVIVSRRR